MEQKVQNEHPRHGLQNYVLKNDDYRKTNYMSDEVLQKTQGTNK
jgi:hypothetical protein